jgi:hypothetical protein
MTAENASPHHHHHVEVVGGRRARNATLLLTLVSLFWGGTFLWMSIGTAALREVFGAEASLSSAAD